MPAGGREGRAALARGNSEARLDHGLPVDGRRLARVRGGMLQVEQVGGKVGSFGSYKLGVVDKESDLDLLCVVPKHVTREDFFNNLYELLRKKVRNEALSSLNSSLFL